MRFLSAIAVTSMLGLAGLAIAGGPSASHGGGHEGLTMGNGMACHMGDMSSDAPAKNSDGVCNMGANTPPSTTRPADGSATPNSDAKDKSDQPGKSCCGQ